MAHKLITRIFFQSCTLLLAFCFFAETPVHAGSVVSAKYKTIAKNSIVFLVEISNPAPANIIVQHFHPAGSRLTASSPAASKVSNNGGYAKWILKNTKPGATTFSLSFANGLPDKNIRLVLRYRDPTTGKFIETEARP